MTSISFAQVKKNWCGLPTIFGHLILSHRAVTSMSSGDDFNVTGR